MKIVPTNLASAKSGTSTTAISWPKYLSDFDPDKEHSDAELERLGHGLYRIWKSFGFVKKAMPGFDHRGLLITDAGRCTDFRTNRPFMDMDLTSLDFQRNSRMSAMVRERRATMIHNAAVECAQCPIRRECLLSAVSHQDDDSSVLYETGSVFGGFGPEDIDKINAALVAKWHEEYEAGKLDHLYASTDDDTEE